MSDITKDLKEIIKGEVSSDEKELSAYSHDASIFEVRPSVAVHPRDAEDIKNLVKWVVANKGANKDLSLTARSGGTDMGGGALNDSIILDFTAHLNRVLEVGEIPPAGGYAITEPGVFYRDFEKQTLAKKLLMPSYPASREICTVGGMVANDSGGEKSLRYGKTEDYVQELNVVLGDGEEYVLKALTSEELEQKKSLNGFEGEIYRQMHELLESNYELIQKARPNVSKNSAGYLLWNVCPPAQAGNKKEFNLAKLFTGAQGTLGLITKIKFRLIKPKKFSRLLIIFLRDLKSLGEMVNLVNKSEPESFESYDDHTFKLAIKILPDLIKRMGIIAMFKFIPDVWAILTGGVPKMVMLVEFTGDEEYGLMDRVKKCQKGVSDEFKIKTRITTSEKDAQKYWIIRRESFNLLRKHVKGKKTAPFIDDLIVRPEYLPEFLPKLNVILDQYKNYMTYTIAGHPGDGNFHIIPLMNLADEKSKQIIPELADKVYDLVLEYHGSITAEHNDGLIRTPYLEKMYGAEVYKLFEKTKQIFDPLNIFNPRKKVGLDDSYAMEHINHG